MQNERSTMSDKIYEEKALFKPGKGKKLNLTRYFSLLTSLTNSLAIDEYNGGIKEVKKVKTAGKGWFNMKQPEMTEELLNDLKTIKMRNIIYKKRFYKGNDTNKLPTYFQVIYRLHRQY